MANPLQQLAECGQSVWIDFISRNLITGGGLQKLIDEEGVVGLTSNPTIFQKAIAEGSAYDERLRAALGRGITAPNELLLELMIGDIQDAADILYPIYQQTETRDGYISLEVPPELAHDTAGTVATAKSLWSRVNRPNLMIKIPATAQGVPAIEESIAAGINVNVTLIFALSAYEQVVWAYIGGLQHRRSIGESVNIHSVASFFVSRVDSAVDPLLEQNRSDPSLLGTAAIANARLAYEKFEHIFGGASFAELRNAGATVQRPLWASTSTKNPAYSDIMYVTNLIGRDTVNTMPPQTVTAFADHGVVHPDTIRDFPNAHDVFNRLAASGIDINGVTRQLLTDGVKLFADSYHLAVDEIDKKVASWKVTR